jgi:hypothetical protein
MLVMMKTLMCLIPVMKNKPKKERKVNFLLKVIKAKKAMMMVFSVVKMIFKMLKTTLSKKCLAQRMKMLSKMDQVKNKIWAKITEKSTMKKLKSRMKLRLKRKTKRIRMIICMHLTRTFKSF